MASTGHYGLPLCPYSATPNGLMAWLASIILLTHMVVAIYKPLVEGLEDGFNGERPAHVNEVKVTCFVLSRHDIFQLIPTFRLSRLE